MRRKKSSPKGQAKIFKPGQSKYWVISSSRLKDYLWLGLTLAFLIGLAVFVNSDVFKVRAITCFKAGLPCNQEETAVLAELKQTNIFFLATETVEKKLLAANPFIDRIIWQRQLPDRLLIELLVRQPSFRATIDGSTWFVIDDQGVVLAQTDNQLDLPELVFSSVYRLEPGQQLSSPLAQNAFLLARTLKLLFVNFDMIRVEFPNRLWLKTGPTEVFFNPENNLKSQVASLQLILSRSRIEGKTPAKIDLRFDKPVVSFN